MDQRVFHLDSRKNDFPNHTNPDDLSDSMKPHQTQFGHHLTASTPDVLEEAMRPAVGDVRVRETPACRFHAELKLFEMPRTVFFSIKIPRLRITLPEGSGFVSVNVISNGQMRTVSPMRGREWISGTAYAVNHDDRRFDFRSDQNLRAMTLCFRKTMLQEYARKFGAGDGSTALDFDRPLDLTTKMGGCFARYFRFVWDELSQGGAFLQSANATEEIEDSLWSLFLSAAQVEMPTHCRNRQGYMRYVKAAEDYILGHLSEPIRVVDIATSVGVSVPTLTRAFRKGHGVGPKVFVKQRRLERVRTELLAADSGTTTVTDVASQYGFWHLSQFAADYRKQFGELPSHTLRNR